LGILFSSILCTCPNQHNLGNLIVSVMVGFLTFGSRVSYIQDGHTATLQIPLLYIFSTNIRTEYFRHAAHSAFFLFKMSFIS
jgi:hypothetical protein